MKQGVLPADEFGIANKYSSDSITYRMSMLSGLTTLLSKIAQLIEAVLTELQVLPEPSAYAHHSTWCVWQKRHTAILNLRPEANQGLPIETLHPVFAAFLNDVRSMRPDEWAPEEDVNTASIDLCKAMADIFDNLDHLIALGSPMISGYRWLLEISSTVPRSLNGY